MLQEVLIEENEFAKQIHVPVSRLIKWRKYHSAPFHRVKRKAYYNSDEFWEWFYNEAFF